MNKLALVFYMGNMGFGAINQHRQIVDLTVLVNKLKTKHNVLAHCKLDSSYFLLPYLLHTKR